MPDGDHGEGEEGRTAIGPPLSTGDELYELVGQEPGGTSPPQRQFALRKMVVRHVAGDRVTFALEGERDRVVSTRERRRAFVAPRAVAVAERAIGIIAMKRAEIDEARLRRLADRDKVVKDAMRAIGNAERALQSVGRRLSDFKFGVAPLAPVVDTSEDLRIAAAVGAGESDGLEFKESLLWALDAGPNIAKDEGERLAVMEIAAFANGAGGELMVGVSDRGETPGLGEDFRRLPRLGKYSPTRDGWQLRLRAKIEQFLGAASNALVAVEWLGGDEDPVASIVTASSDRPVYFRDGGKVDFFLRTGNQTRRLKVDEAIEFSRERFFREQRGRKGRSP